MTQRKKEGCALTHDQLVAGLAHRFPEPHWILMEKVRDCSGFEGSVTADAVAFGLYASRGFEVHAFEAKADRSDWLRELGQPEKAEPIAAMVDYFWVVAPGPEVVPVTDMPAHWGLLYVSRAGADVRVRQVRKALKLPHTRYDARYGNLLARPFVAAMLTRLWKRTKDAEIRAASAVPPSELEPALSKSYDDGVGMGRKAAERELADFRESVERFEQASGIKLERWNGAHVGKEFAAYMEARTSMRHWTGLERTLTSVRTVLSALEKIEQEMTIARHELLGEQKEKVEG
jgi:hypothetical protein